MARRLLPRATPETRDFWDGVRASELRLLRCGTCQRCSLPPRPVCPGCGGSALHSEVASGRGRLHSFVISHLPAPGVEPPIAIAIVELDEGPRLLTNLVDVEPDPSALAIDMPVEVVFEECSDEISLPLFRPMRPSP